jgi:hypothetical protein
MNQTTELWRQLPPVRPFQCLSWDEWFGVDFYGALDVAAEYCGLRDVPQLPPGTWQHGVMPPWQQVQPEVVVYGAPPRLRCFVGRKDEVDYLNQAGYRDVHAIGTPICYTAPTGVGRIPGSVLIMPMHITAETQELPDARAYVQQAALLKDRFPVVAACVSQPCISKGLWAPALEAAGIPVIPGAGLYDANALRRMRTLFESFEVITTQGYGSHVCYALCFGARVSIWGPEYKDSREDSLRDVVWGRFPEALDRYLSPETERRAEEFLGPLRVPPWAAVADLELGRRMVGWGNRRSPDELRRLFGWTRNKLFAHALKRSLPWRGARWLRRRIQANRLMRKSQTK